MFSMITNIYNKKTKGPTLMELFIATGKLKTEDIQAVATHASTCWHVCGNNLNIISMCAVPSMVHTSNISSYQKTLFQFSVAVNNSIKVGRLVFLL